MHPKTIEATFDPSVLPAWARKDPIIVERCRTNYSYRCSVCRATTEQYRRTLTREAHRASGQK